MTRYAIIFLAAAAFARGRTWRRVAWALCALAALDWLSLATRAHARADAAVWAACVAIPAALVWDVRAAWLAVPVVSALAAVAYPHLTAHYLTALHVVVALSSASTVVAVASRRAPLRAPGVVALLLASADPVDLLGAYLAGDPWRDHYVHLWVVGAVYTMVAGVIAVSRPRV